VDANAGAIDQPAGGMTAKQRQAAIQWARQRHRETAFKQHNVNDAEIGTTVT
jgi:hypothetical protein